MKKKVKSLIIAASVAAIAGIGAVSFAAWQNGTTVPTGKGDVTTGEITLTAGFIKSGEETEKTLTFNNTGKNWVPVDQTTGENDLNMLTAQLPSYQVDKGNYTFTLTLGEGQNYQIYYQVAAKAPTLNASGANDAAVISSLGTDWKLVGNGQEITNTDAATIADNAMNLYVVLVSSDTADMNKTVNFTLTLSQN